jgi:hypothetical protein
MPLIAQFKLKSQQCREWHMMMKMIRNVLEELFNGFGFAGKF